MVGGSCWDDVPGSNTHSFPSHSKCTQAHLSLNADGAVAREDDGFLLLLIHRCFRKHGQLAYESAKSASNTTAAGF
jgi:hypothetical protein